MTSHRVSLVAATGREQPVLLKVRREGICFCSESGRDIQQLRYNTLVKWLPSNLRSRDPGGNDCLDIQVETASGKKDLRMRCESAGTVQAIMQEIRATVQAIFAELDPEKLASSSPLKAGLLANMRGTSPSGSSWADQARSTGEPSPAPSSGPIPAAPLAGAPTASPLHYQHQQQERQPQQHEVDYTSQPQSHQQQYHQPERPWQQPQTQDHVQQPQQQQQLAYQQQHQQATGRATAAGTGAVQQSPAPQAQAAYQPACDPPLGTLAFHTHAHPQQEGARTPTLLPAAGRFSPSSNQQTYSQQAAAAGAAGRRVSTEVPASASHVAAAHTTSVITPGGMYHAVATAVTPMQHQQQQLQQQQQQRATGAMEGGTTRTGVAPGGVQTGMVVLGVPVVQAAAGGSLQALTAPATAATPPPPIAAAAGPAGEGWQSSGNPSTADRAPSRSHRSHRDSSSPWPGSQPGAAAAAAAATATGRSADVAALESQVQFLGDMVKRLSAELAQRLASDPQAVAQQLGSKWRDAGHDADHDLMDDVALPPWLSDARYLNPLLGAYDNHIAQLSGALAEKTSSVKSIEHQVRALVDENESLHARLKRQAELLEGRAAMAAAVADSAMDADHARLQEQLELLELENDLLVQQQEALDGEVQRLHRQLQSADTALADARADAAVAAERVAAASQKEKERSRISTNLRATKERCRQLEAHLSAAQQATQQEAAKAAAAAVALDQAAARHEALLVDLAAAQAAGAAVGQLQAELVQVKEAHAAAVAEAAAGQEEVEALRSALRTVETRLKEYQHKDAEVYGHIKEAMELAEEARLERDAALQRQAAATAQVTALQARLADAVLQLNGGASGPAASTPVELKRQLSVAQNQLADAKQQIQQLDQEVSELRVSKERLARDKASLTSELTNLRTELSGEAHPGFRASSSFGLNSHLQPASMAEMMTKLEQLSEVERAREEALQRLESVTRASERSEREWQLERQQLQAEVQAMSKRAADLEARAMNAQATAITAEQTAAATAAELAVLRNSREGQEAKLRQQLAAVRAERDAEVAALAAKLEKALETTSKSVADAERMLESKERLLSRWKDEAQLIARKLEGALVTHRQELQRRDAQLQELMLQLQERDAQMQEALQQISSVQDQNMQLSQELTATANEAMELRLQLQAAQQAAVAAASAAHAREQEIVQELSSVQGQLERALLEKVKAERAKQHMVDRMDRSWDKTLPRFGGSRPATAAAGGGGGWSSPEFERGESRMGYMGAAGAGTGKALRGIGGEGTRDGNRECEGSDGGGVVRGGKLDLMQQQEQQQRLQQQCQQRLADDTLQQHDKSQQAVVAVA